MMNYIENEKELCSAIMLQAINDYKYCTNRIKEIGKEIPAVKKLQTEFSKEVCKARIVFKARRVVINWQSRLPIAREQAIQTEAYRKELEELELELDKCEKAISTDLIPFFEGEWCDIISPVDRNKILSHLKNNFPLGKLRKINDTFMN